MAARKRRGTADTGWDQNVRSKIRSSMLVNFLQNHVEKGTPALKTQVTAALGLLKKTIPDLQSIEGSLNITTHEKALDELE